MIEYKEEEDLMQRPRMEAKAELGYPEFKADYEDMMVTGEGFLQEQVLRTWKMEKFARLKDSCAYYLYRNFVELYNRCFKDEPILPEIPLWHYILTHILHISEQTVNRFFWPKCGAQIEAYMQYYMEKLSEVVEELERTFEIVIPELDDCADGQSE